MAVAPKRAPAPAKGFQRKEMLSFYFIACNAIHSGELSRCFVLICWQTIIIQLNGSFKLRKGLITSDLLLLCARETVLKVLIEQY